MSSIWMGRHLCVEDWKWWWKSFFASGSVALYIFLYSINYLVFDLKSLSGPVSATAYLGYSFLMVLAIMLATGTVGFLSSFWFVHYLFSSPLYNEFVADKINRYHEVIMVISIPLVLISFVIFDAGSSWSRVHVLCFDQNLDLVNIGNELGFFEQLKPGLRAHATNPKEAADSLLPLLEIVEKVVPQNMCENIPVKVGATADLRQLGVDVSE
ncbi:putative apyrase [Helianthus anomalus]